MKFKLFLLTLLALLVASCTREPLPESGEPEKGVGKTVTISVNISPETRVAYDDINLALSWQEGDQLRLAGYDGTTYKGSEVFTYTGTGNKFTGTPVGGATTYKAYYPGNIVTLDANGNVNPLTADFWQQTQNGVASTVHLKSKLLLFDEDPNALGDSFSLKLKSSILKLVLSGINKNVGKLDQLIYMVETASGVFKSVTLDVTGVTFSDALDYMTAFIAFNPTVVKKVVANGKVKITLFGEQPYEWSITSTTGKNYTAGNRHTGTVTGGWTQKVLINPLSYVTEYNINPAGDGFVTDLTACNVSGYFTWQEAVNNFITKNIGGVTYHLPNFGEWIGIVPAWTGFASVRFKAEYSANNITEDVSVNNQALTMTSDFRTTTNNVSYALRYKGTDMLSAWKYEYISAGNNTHLKITSRNVAPSETIGNIANPTYWTTGTANEIVRYFPASGYKDQNNKYWDAGSGHFWASTQAGIDNGHLMAYNTNIASTGFYSKIYGRSVRLFSPGN